MTTSPFFVNLASANLAKTRSFYEALGFKIFPNYTSDRSACFELRDGVYLMLLDITHFESFSPHPAFDPKKQSGVLLCFECDSKAEVDRMVELAAKSGGSTPESAHDLGFMYSHGFLDPDGYPWKLNHIYPKG